MHEESVKEASKEKEMERRGRKKALGREHKKKKDDEKDSPEQE